MCQYRRTVASECGHPLSEDVRLCRESRHSEDPCDPDAPQSRLMVRNVPGKCRTCRQAAIERGEQAVTLAVLEESSVTWSQVHDFETESEMVLRETGAEAEEQAENQHEEELARVMEESKATHEEQQDSTDTDDDEDYKRMLEESKADAAQRLAEQEAEEKSELARIIAESVAHAEQQHADQEDEDTKAAIALSMTEAPDYDALHARDVELALEASRAVALQQHSDDFDEDEIRRILEESASEHQKQQQWYYEEHGALADDDPRLRDVLEHSVDNWHKSTWDQYPDTGPQADPSPSPSKKKIKKKGKRPVGRSPSSSSAPSETPDVDDLSRETANMNLNINVQARAHALAAANAHANANAENRTPSPPRMQRQAAPPRWGSPPPQYAASPTVAGPSGSAKPQVPKNETSYDSSDDGDDDLDDAAFLKKKRAEFLRRFDKGEFGGKGDEEDSGES